MCEDGFIAIEQTYEFLSESNGSPSHTIQFGSAARDISLSKFLTIVNNKGTEMTVYSKGALTPTKLEIDGDSNRLLSSVFH